MRNERFANGYYRIGNGLILTEDGLNYLVTEDEQYYLQQEIA